MELISTQKANKKVCSIEAHKKVKCKSTLKYHLVGFKASSDGSARFHAHLVYQYQILGLPITYMGQFESYTSFSFKNCAFCSNCYYFSSVQALPPEEEKELKETLQDIIGRGKKVKVEQKVCSISSTMLCYFHALILLELMQ